MKVVSWTPDGKQMFTWEWDPKKKPFRVAFVEAIKRLNPIHRAPTNERSGEK